MADAFETFASARVGDQPQGWRQDARQHHRHPYGHTQAPQVHHTVADVASVLGLPPEAVTPAIAHAIGGLMAEIERLRWELEQAHRRENWLGEQTDRDAGLPLLNRRSLMRRIDLMSEWSADAQIGTALLLVRVLSIDAVRASHGLAAADQVAHLVANALSRAVRSSDLVAHVDGGDFAVLLTVTDAAGAKATRAELLSMLSAISFPLGAQTVKLVAKMGLHMLQQGQPGEQALAGADADLVAQNG